MKISIAESLGRYTAMMLCYSFAVPLAAFGFVVGFCSYHIWAGIIGGKNTAKTGIEEIFR